MKLPGCISILAVLATLTGCKHNQAIVDPPAPPQTYVASFSQFFFEKGTDEDSSYISLRGLQKENGLLELQATSWGIRETGLFLHRVKSPRSALFVFMGECGTISTATWEKATITLNLTAADQDTLWRIAFTSHADTIDVAKIRIADEPVVSSSSPFTN
jgi:hypothetical protein